MSSETVLHDNTNRLPKGSDASGDSSAAIRVRNLGKCYYMYDRPRDKLKEALLFGRRKLHREFWALRDVSLDVKPGETVGIVGRNGSGKSTLLQIISGTLAPTTGTVELQGRVAALLELGSGFNPEFTGKENVYMNGATWGLSRLEIDEKYNAIVEFADIGDFINQPVRTYSSGMYVRLAFAVAACVDPEILVVDEALAVGDEMFQRKCFARIDALRANGATILFVSHSANAVVELCDRACLLADGEAVLVGTPDYVIARYHKVISAPDQASKRLYDELRTMALNEDLSGTDSIEQMEPPDQIHRSQPQACYDPTLIPKKTVYYESRGAKISRPEIRTLDGQVVNNLVRRDDYEFTYTVDFAAKAYAVRAGMMVKTLRGIELGGWRSSTYWQTIPVIEAGARLHVSFKFKCVLVPGTYFLNAGVEAAIDGTRGFLDRHVDAAVFRVVPERDDRPWGPVDFLADSSVHFEKGPDSSVAEPGESDPAADTQTAETTQA
jgi:lipopolysaccharide transport system ATP-binding protein